jgi:hypothetical protein
MPSQRIEASKGFVEKEEAGGLRQGKRESDL